MSAAVRPSSRLLLAAAVAAAAGQAVASAPGRDRDPRPSVILLLADDLGHADLSVTGARDLATPNIDSLARNGVNFTAGYVTCPVCAPSRAALLTGRYQQRFGFETNPGWDAIHKPDTGLPPSEETIAARLRQRGYATGLLGKWHLGSHDGYAPTDRGFDYFYGFRGGMRNYHPNTAFVAGTDPYHGAASYLYDRLERNGLTVPEPEYLTDALAEEAVAFLDRHRDRPFFLFVSFSAVHNPLQAPERYRDRFAGLPGERRRIYAGMVAAMDDAVGAILRKLDALGQTGNTLVFFLSDNGGGGNGTAAHSANTARNLPYRGFKFDVYEGGIRVPLLLQWPDRLPGGRVYDRPVSALDVFPTICAATGAGLPEGRPIDGRDLRPFVTGADPSAPHEFLYWRWTFRGGESAVRRGDWKLVMLKDAAPQLYDLGLDPGEQHDQSAEHPALVAELRRAWQDWSRGMAAPRW